MALQMCTADCGPACGAATGTSDACMLGRCAAAPPAYACPWPPNDRGMAEPDVEPVCTLEQVEQSVFTSTANTHLRGPSPLPMDGSTNQYAYASAVL
jgi:hypothetical protein